MTETVWIIMSKDKRYIAKGVPRNRHLVEVADEKDKKRVLTYQSKGRAEAGYKSSWFYTPSRDITPDDIEAVEVQMTMTTIDADLN